MADEKKILPEEEGDFIETYTLTDEEGNEYLFTLIGTCEYNGNVYYALVPTNEESDEYVILRAEEDEDGEGRLSSIDDDEEFDAVADIFDDELFSEVDLDTPAN